MKTEENLKRHVIKKVSREEELLILSRVIQVYGLAGSQELRVCRCFSAHGYRSFFFPVKDNLGSWWEGGGRMGL